MTDLTESQIKYIQEIRQLTDLYGHPPRIAELARQMGVCRQAAHQMIQRLMDIGMVCHGGGKARTLIVMENGSPE